MVPAMTKGGRSFKGAAAYYLHDKRQAGEAERRTAERVAWAEVVNLPTDDPQRAWRMMATTAMKAEELKAAAGVKATGRKMTSPVFAYSLSWHPTEQPTKAEQIEAARATLKLLKLEEHQALIVCHTDEPHAHVHVIVNRVHPTEGKAAALSNSKLALSKWAQAYEQERGQVFCPRRVENNARREQGEFARDPRKSRPAYEFTKAAANDSMRGAFIRAEEKQRDAQLAAAGRAMHDSHGQQWTELKRAYQASKDRLYARANEEKERRAAEIKEQFRPAWADQFRRQRVEQRRFQERERSPLGKIWNMAQTLRDPRLKAAERPAGMLGVVFGLFSGTERATALQAAQQQEQQALARKARKALQQERDRIHQETKRQADALREAYLRQCGELREIQARQQAELRAAWQRRNAERKAAFAPIRTREQNWQRLEELARGQGQARGQGLGRQRDRSMRPK